MRQAHSGTAISRPLRRCQRDDGGLVALPRRRWPGRLDHLAEQLGADLCGGLVEGEGHVGELRGVADDAAVGVAVDVGLPLPRGRVGVPRANVLGLQAFEFLLGAELVGLLFV